MATRNVPGDYPTIAAAVAASSSGDTILVASSYGGNETVILTVDGLVFDASASVTGIVLRATETVSTITLAGASPIAVHGIGNDDTITGNSGANVIDGGGGTNTLAGGGGNDRFLLTSGSSAGGTVNGGSGTDTVQSHDLGGYAFSAVEVLDTNDVTATLAQLFAFGGMIYTDAARSQIKVTLRGAGGTIDFTNRLGGMDSVAFDGSHATSAVTVTGSAHGDYFVTSSFADTLVGGAGDDVFDLDSSFLVAGTIDGGTGTDTVRTDDLGSYSFTAVETLDTRTVSGTVEQLSAFRNFGDSSADSTRIRIDLRRGDGTLDFTNRITGTDSIELIAGYSDNGRYLTGSVNSDILRNYYYNNTLDGGAGDDLIIAARLSGSTDNPATLIGGSGNDTFVIEYDLDAGGTIDGGTGTDTVQAELLGTYAFSRVETLDTARDFATLQQLSAFGSIVDSTAESTRITMYLSGAGGTIDFTNLIGGTDSVNLHSDFRSGLTGGITVTGSANADLLYGSAYDDVLRGGDGDDEIVGNGGNNNTLIGGDGDDVFHLGGGGTVDGGSGTDTVQASGLGSYSFTDVEILDIVQNPDYYPRGLSTTTAQLSSFDSIVDSFSDSTRIIIELRGAGGTIDFTDMVTGSDRIWLRNENVMSG